jgi:hypothetical protein
MDAEDSSAAEGGAGDQGAAGGRLAASRPGRRRWQVGLPTLLLLMAAIAVWMAYLINRRQNARLEARIRASVPLVHELVIHDPAKIAVVKLEEYWHDENRWDVYLPDGPYRLCLATRGIDDQGLAPVVTSRPIEAGRRLVALEDRVDGDVRRVTVAVDGNERLTVEEPEQRGPRPSSSTNVVGSSSQQLPADLPAEVFRRRYRRQDAKGRLISSHGWADGILLWIERTPGPNVKP